MALRAGIIRSKEVTDRPEESEALDELRSLRDEPPEE